MTKFDHLDDRALWAAIIDSENSVYACAIALDECTTYSYDADEMRHRLRAFESANSKHRMLINERNSRLNHWIEN
jgi:hypothetical protein